MGSPNSHFVARRGGPARLERRLVANATSTSPTPSIASTATSAHSVAATQSMVAALLPSTKSTIIGLSVVVSVFGAVILVIIGWKIRSWMTKRPKTASSEDGEHAAFVTRVNEKPVLVPPKPAEGTTWVPQMKGANIHSNVNASTAVASAAAPTASQSAGGSPVRDSKISRKRPPSEHSPPPSYFIANGSPGSAPSTPLQLSKAAPSTDVPPTPITPPPTQSNFRPLPNPFVVAPSSPVRTSSFAPQQAVSSSSGKGLDGRPLPRLVKVSDTFVPSLDDELVIELEESLRLLEEYQDGWCLVQRVGKAGEQKGVVPRFCLRETSSAKTTTPTTKTTRSP